MEIPLVSVRGPAAQDLASRRPVLDRVPLVSTVTQPALRLSHLTVAVPGRVLVAGGDLQVAGGEVVVMLGRSGSGKTSLINVAAGIVRPRAGVVAVAGEEISSASGSARARHRLRHIGLVFQFAELLPELTVSENVALPLLLAGAARDDATVAAHVALDRVGLSGYGEQWPELVSGGEAQRAAIARAIAPGPALVLADEPTGALDEENSRAVGSLFREIAAATGCGILVGTHDPVIAAFADRTIRIEQARLVV